MVNYNYGTAVNKLINSYNEMLELIVQARIATDRIDEWKKDLDLVTNPDQTRLPQTMEGLAFRIRNILWMCGECEEIRIDDERVLAGMKCGHCAYGGGYL